MLACRNTIISSSGEVLTALTWRLKKASWQGRDSPWGSLIGGLKEAARQVCWRTVLRCAGRQLLARCGLQSGCAATAAAAVHLCDLQKISSSFYSVLK